LNAYFPVHFLEYFTTIFWLFVSEGKYKEIRGGRKGRRGKKGVGKIKTKEDGRKGEREGRREKERDREKEGREREGGGREKDRERDRQTDRKMNTEWTWLPDCLFALGD
jgi:hypothetical protein